MSKKPKHERVLVAITGSKKPYVYDLPQLLALPEGLEFRFRFRDRWVDERVREEMRDGGPSRQPLLLVYWSAETGRLIPLRWARLTNIQRYGPVTYCAFSLRGFAVDVGREWSTTKLVSAFWPGREDLDLKRALPSHLFWVEEGLVAPDTAHLEFPNGSSELDPSGWARQWWQIVRRFAPDQEEDGCILEDGLLGLPLFHVLGFFDEKGDHRRVEIIRNKCGHYDKDPAPGYELTMGENYRLKVVQWCALKQGSHLSHPLDLDCVTETSGLKKQGAFSRVYGRYDVINIDLRAVSLEDGEIALKTSAVDILPGAEGDDHRGADGSVSKKLNSWKEIDAFRVPVSVVPSALRRAGVALAVLVGIPLFFAAEIWPALGASMVIASRAVGAILVALAFPALQPIVSTAGGVHRLFR